MPVDCPRLFVCYCQVNVPDYVRQLKCMCESKRGVGYWDCVWTWAFLLLWAGMKVYVFAPVVYGGLCGSRIAAMFYVTWLSFAGEDFVVGSLYNAQEPDGVLPDLIPFFTRCFISRLRCLLDSTSGFLVSEDTYVHTHTLSTLSLATIHLIFFFFTLNLWLISV